MQRFWMIPLIGLPLCFAPAQAKVEFRWFTAGGMQGTVVAGVQNEGGSYFRIMCVTGTAPQKPVLQYDPKRGGLAKSEAIQVIVGEEAFHFQVDAQGLAELDARGNRTEFARLTNKLAGSREAAFMVEVPRTNVSERFTLKDGRKALGPPGKTLIEGCDL